jgi:hypothetical protein
MKLNTYNAYKFKCNDLEYKRTLEEYTCPEFDPDVYPNQPNYRAKLDAYLKEIGSYVKKLSLCARLRQQHFEDYIDGKFEEESRHCKWRLGFNRVAEEGRITYRRWLTVLQQIDNDEFDEALRRQEILYYVPEPDLRNPDKEEPKQVFERVPKMSAAEREKRRKAKEEAKAQMEIEEKELIEHYTVPDLTLTVPPLNVTGDVVEFFEADPTKIKWIPLLKNVGSRDVYVIIANVLAKAAWSGKLENAVMVMYYLSNDYECFDPDTINSEKQLDVACDSIFARQPLNQHVTLRTEKFILIALIDLLWQVAARQFDEEKRITQFLSIMSSICSPIKVIHIRKVMKEMRRKSTILPSDLIYGKEALLERIFDKHIYRFSYNVHWMFLRLAKRLDKSSRLNQQRLVAAYRLRCDIIERDLNVIRALKRRGIVDIHFDNTGEKAIINEVKDVIKSWDL